MIIKKLIIFTLCLVMFSTVFSTWYTNTNKQLTSKITNLTQHHNTQYNNLDNF